MNIINKKITALLIISILGIFSTFGQETKGGKIYQADLSNSNYEIQATDIVYKSENGINMTLDIIKEKGTASEIAPVVIYVHGGNWNTNNSTEVHRPYIESMLKTIIGMGYKVVSINYRLGSEKSPVNFAISDTKDAVRWVKKNAEEYNLDSSKVVLWGTSAGGHISQFAAYSSDKHFKGDPSLAEYSSSVSGLIDCYGPSNILRVFKFKSGIAIKIGKAVSKKLFNYFLTISQDFSGIDYREDKHALREFMVNHSTSSIQFPRNVPTLILHGTSDKVVSIKDSRELKKYLDSYGIENTLKEYKKVKHSFEKINQTQMINIMYSTQNFLNSLK